MKKRSEVSSSFVTRTASYLSTSQMKKMAECLGWPDVDKQLWGHVKWANPNKNQCIAPVEDPDWVTAEEMGLSETIGHGYGAPTTGWRVTDLGQLVLRTRMESVRLTRLYNANK